MKTFRKHLALLFAIASAGVMQEAAAQVTAQFECQYVGVTSQEPIGDRDGHVLRMSSYSCRVMTGPHKGGVYTGNNVTEWDGPTGIYVSGNAVTRVPGGIVVSSVTGGTLAYIMKDGKPVGVISNGTGRTAIDSGPGAPFAGKSFKFSSKTTGLNQFTIDVTYE
jgi:hypothetical protein